MYRVAAATLIVAAVVGGTLIAGAQDRPSLAPPAADGSPVAVLAPVGFQDIVARLSPSVVAVTTRSRQEQTRWSGFQNGRPPLDFFGQFFGDERPEPRTPPRRGALGSGFVIDDDGHIVTNNHVVANGDEIRVVLADRSAHTATLVGRDPETDIAVLKLDDPVGQVEPLQWGNSDSVQPGAWTIAIGSPFGLGGTVTVGVLSARSRDIRSGPYDDFLQTDASINTGNSGGPLFDVNGFVIGVNTAIVSPSGGNVGIGFAIPASLARNVVEEIVEKGKVERGYIGATLQSITPEIASSLGLADTDGALVASVTRGSPAASGGLQPGDVIVAFDGTAVESVRELTAAVASTDPGEDVPVAYIRNGDRAQTNLAIEIRPDSAVARAALPSAPPANDRLGVALAPLDEVIRDRLNLTETERGVIVTQVAPDSPAADSGLQVGDIITSAGNNPVAAPADVSSYWRNRPNGQAALFRIRRGDSYVFVAVKTPRESAG